MAWRTVGEPMKRWKRLATVGAVVVVGSLLTAAPSGATVIKPTVTGFASEIPQGKWTPNMSPR